jgi:[ribosomal protein S18]-alanine N-acetyltransferase
MTNPDKINIILRRMDENDIGEVQDLEKLCFNHTWPEDSFKKELSNRNTACYLVARNDRRLAGFIGSWLILDETHVTTIAVSPDFRGMRIGDLLVWGLFQKAIEKGCRWATLEVNEKNEAACKLYESFGFKPIGKRSSYYGPDENAVVMWRKGLLEEQFKELLKVKRTRWEEKICLSSE